VRRYADRLGIPFFEASAKAGINVEQAFAALAAELKAQHIAAAEAAERAREERDKRLRSADGVDGVEVQCGCFSLLISRPAVRYAHIGLS